MNHEEWTDRQTATMVRVDGHGLEVAYYGSGPDRSPADTLVFLHGIPTWSFLWRDVAPAFEEEYRVIAPDLLGYGNSASGEGFDRSIRAQEAMVEALLDELGEERVTLVAHDIGGGVALRLAAHSPERVDRLVLSNAVCYDSWPVEFVSDLGLPGTADRDHEAVMATVRGAFELGVYADDAEEAFVEGMVAPWDSEQGQVSLSRNAVATNTNHTTELDYGAIEADLLCLWGKDDSFQPPAYGERLAEEVGGEVVELAAYHWVVQDRPEEYAEEVTEFLTE